MKNIVSFLSNKKKENVFYAFILLIPSKLWRLFYLFCPTKIYLKFLYKQNFGRSLDLKNPKRFTEKIQWKKIYDKNPLYVKLADKYEVREYIKQKIGEEYLIPLLYQTDKPEEIPFDKLKPPYIIKSNHGSGEVIIVRDKKDIHKKKIIKKLKSWLKSNIYYIGREWQYKNIPPKIIVEKMLKDKNNELPIDYKFHCFNGKVEFIWVCRDRFKSKKIGCYNKNWEQMDFILGKKGEGSKPRDEVSINFVKPRNLNEMVKIAELLSKNFDYIRVDLYDVKGKVYFGELTFHPGSGFSHFFPEKYDLIYGKKLKLKS